MQFKTFFLNLKEHVHSFCHICFYNMQDYQPRYVQTLFTHFPRQSFGIKQSIHVSQARIVAKAFLVPTRYTLIILYIISLWGKKYSDGCKQTFTEPLNPGGSDGKESACNAGDLGTVPGSERSDGEGNSNPLQDSCLENSMDSRALQATVHWVAKSWIQLSN